MAHSGEAHYQTIASIQQSMHQREKRRLALERELFACSRPDKRVSQMRRSKLHSYLKEICDREARAKIRNLELLRDVECIETGMKEYSPDRGPLQQQKDEFFRKIANFTGTRERAEQTHLLAEANEDRSVSHPAGRPGAEAEAAALHRSPDRSRRSGTHPASGPLEDFRGGEGDGASEPARLLEGISDSGDSPGGRNLSDSRERTRTARIPSVPADGAAAAATAPFGSRDGQRPSPLVTLTEPEMNTSLSSSSSLAEQVKNRAEPGEEAPQAPAEEAEEEVAGHSVPGSAPGKDARHTAGACEDDGAAGSDVDSSDSSESDRSLSLTQSELEEEEDEEQGEEEQEEEEAPERSATSGPSDGRSRHSPESASGSADDSPQRSWRTSEESLSLEGLFHLLESIEGRLRCEQAVVYGTGAADDKQLRRITSLCNRRAGVNGEELDVCGAAVLRGLQSLSRSTTQGCVLPRQVVSAHRDSTDPSGISASLTPDAARLWDRWFKHALLLKERRVLGTEHLVQLFTPLLLERDATYGHQAKVLLRTLVSRSSEECPPTSAEDRSDPPSSSLSWPGPAVERHGGPTTELQSGEEDSPDESPVESVPIRETKAYQLLKQSAMQERLPSSEEEEEDDAGLSGINDWRDEDLGRAKRSSHQDPYPRTNAASSKSRGALRPRAFLCDSDESSSDIEAALRPQPLSANADDFDDFAD